MKPVTLVVLSKYLRVLTPFFESSQQLSKCERILVKDPDGDVGWNFLGQYIHVDGKSPFRMAVNANLGLRSASPDEDVLYCGDDIRFIYPDTIERLQEVAYASPDIGLVSPELIGRTSVEMSKCHGYIVPVSPMGFWFPCVYMKREVIDKVGYLDERFHSFCDDMDYSVRVRKAGYKLVCTSYCQVRHEGNPDGSPTTFGPHKSRLSDSYDLFCEKWGMTPQDLEQFSKTGDINLCLESTSAKP